MDGDSELKYLTINNSNTYPTLLNLSRLFINATSSGSFSRSCASSTQEPNARLCSHRSGGTGAGSECPVCRRRLGRASSCLRQGGSLRRWASFTAKEHQNRPRRSQNHRITEWSGLKGTSVGHPAQPPAEAGSPRAGCTAPRPGGS